MTDDTNRRAWEPILARLEQRRAASRAMGGAERVERHHARGKLDARQRIAALFDPGTFAELGVHGRAREPGRCARRGSRPDRRPARARGGRGLHRAGRLDRHRRGRQALPARAARAPGTGAAGVHARGRGPPPDEQAERAQAQRPPGARRAVGHRADGVPGAGPVGRTRRPDRAALRFRRHDPRLAAVQRGSAPREGRDRRRRDEGGARRAAGARRRLGRRAQPRATTPTPSRSRAATSRTFPRTRGRRRPSSTDRIPVPGGSTTCST